MKRWKVLNTKKMDASLAFQLQQHGMDVIEKDLIHIKPAITATVIEQVRSAVNKTVIFTSSNAVHAVSKYLADIPVAVICMAGRTKEAVQDKLAKATIVHTAENAKAIAEKIIDREIKEVTFFCGDIRRDELPDVLKGNNVKVNEVVVYATEETPVRVNDIYDAVVFYSPSAVRSFFKLNNINEAVVCFAIGETTAEETRRFTNNKIIVAKKPSQEAVATELINYHKDLVLS